MEEQASNTIELFIQFLQLGAFITIIFMAGYFISQHKELKKDFEKHQKNCREDKNKMWDELRKKVDK